MQTSSIRLHWRLLEDVFTPLWTIKPLTTGTSSGLPSSRLPDRHRRLQDIFIEDFLKTSSHVHPWGQLKPLTRGTSSWLPSSRLPDQCRRLQDVFIKDFIEDVFTPLRTIKTVIWEGDVFRTTFNSSPRPVQTSSLKPSLRRLHNVFHASARKCHVREISFVQHAYCDYDFHFNTTPPEWAFAMPINV